MSNQKKYNYKPYKLEFSKKLLVFASLIYIFTWFVVVFSWVIWHQVPIELMEYSTWLYGSTCAFYLAKAGYENKTKFEFYTPKGGKN